MNLLDSVSVPITQAEIDAVYEADERALAARAAAPNPAEHDAKPRKFRLLDEAWAERLLADPSTPPHVRLLIVLLAEADFHRHIKITDVIRKIAGLSRWQMYRALERVQRQGYVSVERPGRGKAPIVTPLHLTRRLAPK
jgi:hypothetical protein